MRIGKKVKFMVRGEKVKGEVAGVVLTGLSPWFACKELLEEFGVENPFENEDTRSRCHFFPLDRWDEKSWLVIQRILNKKGREIKPAQLHRIKKEEIL